MFRWIDESPLLNKIFPKVSATMSRNRGVPILFGIFLVIIAFLVQLVNILVDNTLLELLQVILHNGGILTALIGFLLVEPLR